MFNQEELRRKYNPEGSDLRNLQYRMLEILKCVHAICEKHHIRYWLSSGTLLGAVRHGGFIPWDDDLDIEMLREDYLKLMEVLPKELPEQYVLQNNQTDPNYVYLYAKVRDRNSRIEEACPVNQNFKYKGVFIDIFMLESTNLLLKKISVPLYNRLIFGLAMKEGIWKYVLKFNKSIILKVLFPLFRIISKLESSETINHTYGVGFPKQRNLIDIFPLKKIEFEGIFFNAPQNVDAYLTKLYGCYMDIPKGFDIHVERLRLW